MESKGHDARETTAAMDHPRHGRHDVDGNRAGVSDGAVSTGASGGGAGVHSGGVHPGDGGGHCRTAQHATGAGTVGPNTGSSEHFDRFLRADLTEAERATAKWRIGVATGGVAPAASRRFAADLDAALEEVRSLLIEKNAAYGDSALAPVRIFSRVDSLEQIRIRIDDKLSRLARGAAAGEDVVMDLLGYLVLLRIGERRREDEATGLRQVPL